MGIRVMQVVGLAGLFVPVARVRPVVAWHSSTESFEGYGAMLQKKSCRPDNWLRVRLEVVTRCIDSLSCDCHGAGGGAADVCVRRPTWLPPGHRRPPRTRASPARLPDGQPIYRVRVLVCRHRNGWADDRRKRSDVLHAKMAGRPVVSSDMIVDPPDHRIPYARGGGDQEPAL